MRSTGYASVLTLCTAIVPSTQAASQTAAPVVEQSQRPNVLVWMMDDVGFAQLSCFGGMIETPNIDRVAAVGLRYSNYHTAPICSASRAAFLTGRNPHSVHLGGHAGSARPYPGYDARVPASAGTIPENLRQGGYVTYALGKWDHLPITEQSGSGPFTHWPLGQGFDRYYGFLQAETNNWSPLLVEDNTPIPTPSAPGYHLNDDLADHAIEMISARDSRGATRPPFFMYWATGAAHAPHHAPKYWIDHYRGRFDMGWDAAREQILQAEIDRGLIAKGAQLAERPEGMPAWDSLSADQKRLYARQMEVFAASLSYADAEFGRILDMLQARGELDNTMVIITSDNGASAEGAYYGTYSEYTFMNNHVATDAENMPFLDRWGGPETYPHYAFGWAVAGNTPFRYYKQTAHEGGTRVPLVIAWPKGIAARGEVRDQFSYVTDLGPTILQATDIPLAKTVNNTAQTPMEGRSLVAGFSNPDATDTVRAQYTEMYGNKGLWSDGWSLVTTHRTKAWDLTSSAPIDEAWELYSIETDPGQLRNVAAEHPERVAAMAREFEAQAERYHVNPIDNVSASLPHTMELIGEEIRRRGGVWRFDRPVARMTVFSAPPVMQMSYKMSADVTLRSRRETGPIYTLGGKLGGLGLYLDQGRPVFSVCAFDGSERRIESRSALPSGTSRLEVDFVRGRQPANQPVDIQVTIKSDGRVLASQNVQMALPFAILDSFDVGSDHGNVLSSAYAPSTDFPGVLRNVSFDFRAALAEAARDRAAHATDAHQSAQKGFAEGSIEP